MKKKLKVLLVDDEKEFVDSLSERLSLRDLDTGIAYNGEEALKAVKTEEPDLMVLDLRMPGIDGLEVLRRAKRSNPDVQVIILTGHGSDKEEKEAKRLGAIAYLQKPVDIDQLVGALHKEKLKVLLVDDEREFVDSLSERLELRNIEPEIAYDGEQALKAVKEGNPDLMVLDLRMPGIDGMKVLRKVRKTNPDVQVVILTGHGTDREEEEAKKLGAFAYLKKPADIDQLVSVMNRAWKRLKKARRSIDSVIMAAAFAQAGEREMARETMDVLAKELEEDEKPGNS